MEDAMCCLFILQIHENQRDLLVCLLSVFVSVKDQSEWVGLIWGISTNQLPFLFLNVACIVQFKCLFYKMQIFVVYKTQTLLELGVSRCRTLTCVRHRHNITPIITLNYKIFSNYYLCRCCVWFLCLCPCFIVCHNAFDYTLNKKGYKIMSPQNFFVTEVYYYFIVDFIN